MLVRLRGKVLANNSISLYLDFYQGYSLTDEGKISIKRTVEYLKLYLIGNPSTPQERRANKETLDLAQEIRNKRESDFRHKDTGLVAPYKKRVNFFDFCQSYIDTYKKKDIRMIRTAINQFKEFTGQDFLPPTHITKKTVSGYLEYLEKKYKGETPSTIFKRFKKVLKAATNEGLFTESPAQEITVKETKTVNKAILTIDEIELMAKAHCPNNEVKRAFMLCLNTGLRFVDVNDLQYKHITHNKIIKPQSKTGELVAIDLNSKAIEQIGEHGQPDEKVFNLPSFTGALKSLRVWAANAGISKRLTWHSARHSFATNLLTKGANINTVKSLMGHRDLTHTQKYTHIVDELKQQAVDRLANDTKK